MTRGECLKMLAPLMTDHLVVTSQSGQRIEWSHLSERDGNLLLGQMGCALGVGAGLSLALPHRKVVVLESDGSVLLSLFNLPTLARLNPADLVVYVFDNGVYSGSRISEPTATGSRANLEALAKAAGIRNAATIRSARAFKKDGVAMLNKRGFRFVVCKVEESLLHREIPRPTIDLAENKYRFVRYLERTEGKAIPFVGRG
ncbi:MAG TPA: thiamine pyrophosphate-dependent enzyme [Candidatus Binatia bacterium]|nr:thiamine pyrophosphate-dependent enzyme [Candidatus Binatia bacterium]